MAAAMLRRIVALALARTSGYGPQTIAAPGLISAVPDERLSPRAGIF
jgi:hypothetical protein